jgi:hypothetical protein
MSPEKINKPTPESERESTIAVIASHIIRADELDLTMRAEDVDKIPENSARDLAKSLYWMRTTFGNTASIGKQEARLSRKAGWRRNNLRKNEMISKIVSATEGIIEDDNLASGRIAS